MNKFRLDFMTRCESPVNYFQATPVLLDNFRGKKIELNQSSFASKNKEKLRREKNEDYCNLKILR